MGTPSLPNGGIDLRYVIANPSSYLWFGAERPYPPAPGACPDYDRWKYGIRGAPPEADVPKIKAAILVHHGGEDTRLVQGWPAYDAALTKAGVVHEGHIYPGAVHGFNNNATPERYNKVTAQQAWNRTIEWFNQYTRA